ncbi:MAG: hypothetical protein VCC99_00165 [Alphaproteobacteria bacterium]
MAAKRLGGGQADRRPRVANQPEQGLVGMSLVDNREGFRSRLIEGRNPLRRLDRQLARGAAVAGIVE